MRVVLAEWIPAQVALIIGETRRTRGGVPPFQLQNQWLDRTILQRGRPFFEGLPSCLEQVESAFPRGTHVSCSDEVDIVAPHARGRVCAGSAGTDAL